MIKELSASNVLLIKRSKHSMPCRCFFRFNDITVNFQFFIRITEISISNYRINKFDSLTIKLKKLLRMAKREKRMTNPSEAISLRIKTKRKK